MPAYGVYEEKMCGLNGSSGGTGKFGILHTMFENQFKHTANKFAVLDRENEIAKLKCKKKIQEMFDYF